jgi:hypothetical protein
VFEGTSERDLLVLAKTVAANDFPVERQAVIGVDRETGQLLRVAPFPWKGADTDPPVQRWSWLQARLTRDERDTRPETATVDGEIAVAGYVDAKEGWRLRWPFVRAHLRGSVESLTELARGRSTTVGFVPVAELDVVQLPLRMRFRCRSEDCTSSHELVVLDQELHAMARLARERYGPEWATRFREAWGAPLLDRYDVHLLLSAYAQAPSKLYVAGLFYPPRTPENEHEHVHHVEHRRHVREAG